MNTVIMGDYMSVLTVQHAFFKLLRNEHRQIEQSLELMLKNDDNKIYAEWLWQNAELTHHFKEETLLFNSLVDNLHVNSGGPLCMLFFDNYILYPPLEECKKITGKIPELEEHQKKIFDIGSSMQVPVNEHRAGKEILKFTLNSWSEINLSERMKNLKQYAEIQREHLNKEENCFFYLCADLLTVEQADLLLKKWNQK